MGAEVRVQRGRDGRGGRAPQEQVRERPPLQPLRRPAHVHDLRPAGPPRRLLRPHPHGREEGREVRQLARNPRLQEVARPLRPRQGGAAHRQGPRPLRPRLRRPDRPHPLPRLRLHERGGLAGHRVHRGARADGQEVRGRRAARLRRGRRGAQGRDQDGRRIPRGGGPRARRGPAARRRPRFAPARPGPRRLPRNPRTRRVDHPLPGPHPARRRGAPRFHRRRLARRPRRAGDAGEVPLGPPPRLASRRGGKTPRRPRRRPGGGPREGFGIRPPPPRRPAARARPAEAGGAGPLHVQGDASPSGGAGP